VQEAGSAGNCLLKRERAMNIPVRMAGKHHYNIAQVAF